MQKCVIIGGAKITRLDRIKQYINNDDFVIACDSGINNSKLLGVLPNLIVGDFDSSDKPLTKIETITLPREKDDTDSIYAIKEAIKRGFKQIVLLGTVGERLDHSLANVYALKLMADEGVEGAIIDDYSVMSLVDDSATVDSTFSYFSIIAIDGNLEDVCIKNAKFPLENGMITPSYQYAVSNEVLPGKTAEVKIGKGCALLIKVF